MTRDTIRLPRDVAWLLQTLRGAGHSDNDSRNRTHRPNHAASELHRGHQGLHRTTETRGDIRR